MTESDKRPPPPPDFDVVPDDDLPPQRKSNTALGVWIVVVVVGLFLMAGLLLMGGTDRRIVTSESNVSAAEAQMAIFGAAIDNYRVVYEELPSSLMDLSKVSDRNPHPFLQWFPDDPWGNAYDYRVIDQTTYLIRSNGEDGVPDTEDDIVYPSEW